MYKYLIARYDDVIALVPNLNSVEPIANIQLGEYRCNCKVLVEVPHVFIERRSLPSF